MQDQDAEQALWWVAAAGGFLAWQVGGWLVARGRWQRAKEAGRDMPPPAFMGETADYLATLVADMGDVVVAALPPLCGIAWVGFVLLAVVMPLANATGFLAALAGGLVVCAAGTVPFIIILQRVGKRRRQ